MRKREKEKEYEEDEETEEGEEKHEADHKEDEEDEVEEENEEEDEEEDEEEEDEEKTMIVKRTFIHQKKGRHMRNRWSNYFCAPRPKPARASWTRFLQKKKTRASLSWDLKENW